MEGEAEKPRTLLMSVPYALKAADAETIGGLPPSAFVKAAAPGAASPAASPADLIFKHLSLTFTAASPHWRRSAGRGNSHRSSSGSDNTLPCERVSDLGLGNCLTLYGLIAAIKAFPLGTRCLRSIDPELLFLHTRNAAVPIFSLRPKSAKRTG